MNCLRTFRTSARQRGVGLIELMIGLTAGLVLIGALAYFFLGARQLNRTHEDVSRMQESGRIALEIMGKAIRQAGARNAETSVNFTRPFALGAVNALDAIEGASSAPDGITVRYDVQEAGEADCLGNAVAHPGRLTYVFAIDTATHALTCTNGTGATPVVVMDNIEDMQITYGIDSNDDGAIESYQSATGLDPKQVAAVRVSLLARGPTERGATGTQTYTFNDVSTTVTDGTLRQVYTATFTVRNQAQ